MNIEPGTIGPTVEYLLNLGARGLAFVFILASYRGWLYWHWQVKELKNSFEAERLREREQHIEEMARCRADAQEFKQIAFRMVGHAEQATNIAVSSIQKRP